MNNYVKPFIPYDPSRRGQEKACKHDFHEHDGYCHCGAQRKVGHARDPYLEGIEKRWLRSDDLPKYWRDDATGVWHYSHYEYFPGIIGKGRNRREAYMDHFRLAAIQIPEPDSLGG